MFGLFKKKLPKRFPPVPDWRPDFGLPIKQVVERVQHYSNRGRDFAVFANGTVAMVPDGLSDASAEAHATEALRKVFHAHVDMNPLTMTDGNLLIHYNFDVASVVIDQIALAHWDVIERRHVEGLATDEVLITPLGPNVFDDVGKKILFGRCYMFMDAQSPQVVQIVRASA